MWTSFLVHMTQHKTGRTARPQLNSTQRDTWMQVLNTSKSLSIYHKQIQNLLFI